MAVRGAAEGDSLSSEPRRHEVAVIGGGPAGATAARLLRRWGHSVLLLTRDRNPSAAIAESLPPSCRRLFRHLEIEQELDAAGFRRTTGNTVWWGSDEARVEWFPVGESGWQVRSTELEAVLLELAVKAGVEVIRGASVREVGGVSNQSSGPTRVVADIGGEVQTLPVTWVLDASGRSGVLARHGMRRPFTGAATLALAASWVDSADWDLPDPSHTLVEGYEDGWAWSVPLLERRRFLAVMVDPLHTELAEERERAALYEAEIAKTRFLAPLLLTSERSSAVLACDASSYTSELFAGPGFFLLGDAGSFIDPLSSYGVKKAMASGWLAAVCIHTITSEPEMRDACLDLYNRRERQVFESYRRLSARYFADGGGDDAGSFWRERAVVSGSDFDEDLRFDVAMLREDPEVLDAFAMIKAGDLISLQLGPDVVIERRAIVEGRRVVMADHLVSSWAPDGIRFLRDVELPRLVALASAVRTVPDLFEAYNGAGSPTTLPDFLGALSVCLAKGLIGDDSVR